MLERIRIKNFRCFSEFELDLTGLNSCVILGRNGSGKTTIASVIQILQNMAWKTSRVGDLLKPSDISRSSDGSVSFNLDVRLFDKNYNYNIAFELPDRFHELRVADESLSVDSEIVYTRHTSQIALNRSQMRDAQFGVDWHVVALPIIQTSSSRDPIAIFKEWLKNIVVVRPVPACMKGESDGVTLIPNEYVDNFGEWFSGVLAESPSSYEPFIEFLREVMPDISSVKNRILGLDIRSLEVEFRVKSESFSVPFGRLSDGEKCFFVCALIVAMASEKLGMTCFWDEPDNYLAPQEVSPTMLALRRSFQSGRQIIITSHNADAIRCFSDDNTIVLTRSSHLAPPVAEMLSDLHRKSNITGSAINLWLRGDLDK